MDYERAPAVFDWRDLEAVRNTFCAPSSSPTEICLRLRPRRRSRHFIVTALMLLMPIGMVLRCLYDQVAPLSENVQAVLLSTIDEAWVMILGTSLLFFVVLPRVLLPTFEIVIRPGQRSVVLRGMGFEQERLAGFCSASGRLLWSSFRVDSVGYSVLRRWWQVLLPTTAGIAALNRILAPSQAALRELLTNGGGSDEISDSVGRMLWVTVFGEAFLSENELAVLRPTPIWHMFLGWAASPLLGYPLLSWHEKHPLDIVPDPALISAHLSWMPHWFPALLVIAYGSVVAMWADAWIRRAFIVFPKGRQIVELRAGKRVLDTIPIDDRSFSLHYGQDIQEPGSYIGIKAGSFSGTYGFGSSLQDLKLALVRLMDWAGVDSKAREESRG